MKRALIFVALILPYPELAAQALPVIASFSSAGAAPITLITSAGAGNSGSSTTATTGAVSDVGSNYDYIHCIYFAGGSPPTASDSASNTWTPLTSHCGLWVCIKDFYAENPTTNASHTFTCSSFFSKPAIQILAFSGVASSSTLESQIGATGDAILTLQTGLLTPAAPGELLIASVGFGDLGTDMSGDSLAVTFSSVDSGFIVSDSINDPATFDQMGGALAYQIQTTATARNPLFTVTVPMSGWAKSMAASLAVIK